MDKARAVEHFLYYLAHHPALQGLSRPNVLLGHTERYDAIAQAITHGSAARFNFQLQRLDLAPSEALVQAIEACDLYLFLYDSSTLPNPRAEGPDFIRALHGVMAEHWKKSLLFKDYGDYFYDTFSVEPQRIADLNATLIRRMSQANVLSFTDKHGSRLEAPMSSIKKWTNINGVGNHDLAPGEIATHSEAINGQVRFVGTFLSTIPFARKYGVLQSPLELWIENSTICSVASDVPGLADDFNKYLNANPSNRRVEELGIGTNEGSRIFMRAMPGSRSAIAGCTWAWAAGRKAVITWI